MSVFKNTTKNYLPVLLPDGETVMVAPGKSVDTTPKKVQPPVVTAPVVVTPPVQVVPNAAPAQEPATESGTTPSPESAKSNTVKLEAGEAQEVNSEQNPTNTTVSPTETTEEIAQDVEAKKAANNVRFAQGNKK